MGRVKLPGGGNAGVQVQLDPGINPDSHFARCRWWLYVQAPDGRRLSSQARDLYGWCVAWYGHNRRDGLADSIYPRQETLAADLGWSVSKVKRAVSELEGWHGLLVVKREPVKAGDRKGQYRNNRYVFYTGPYPPWDREGKLPLPWKHHGKPQADFWDGGE